MTKQHFQLFAAQIRHDLNHAATKTPGVNYEQAERTARYAAIVFAQVATESNPRFDRERFMLACGLQ